MGAATGRKVYQNPRITTEQAPESVLQEIERQVDRYCRATIEEAFADLIVEPENVVPFPVKRVKW